MERKLIRGILIIGIVFFSTSSFTPEDDYTPVFMKRSELANSVRFVSEARELKRPGKIYYKSPYIFINERYKGIHVIDNSNPASPRNVGFIIAPGCIDMAVKGYTLYLDNSVDLVAFDLETREVTSRVESVFPEPAHPNNSQYRFKDKPEDMVVVEWKSTNI